MKQPICFGCRYFKQYHPLTFREPGECVWAPKDKTPEWLQVWLYSTDMYYGPHREVSTAHPLLNCEAYEEKTDG